jgi:glycosyltransferase involved in cell wall biosynthesis
VGINRRGVHKIKIALVNNYLPFVYGGAEMVVDTLRDKLLEHGHQVSVTRVPFPSTLDHALITNMLTCRCLSFDDADKVIAFKFPAYYVRHENKTLWMFHQLRQVYELWNTEYGLQHTPENVRIRDTVTSSDNAYLREAKEIFGISHEIADRLRKFNGLEASVLYTPLDHRRCRALDYGDYLLYASRVTSFKRQHLAIESMKHTKTGVRLVLAGKCDEPDYETRLRKLIDDNGLGARVTMLGWIDDERKFELMAEALASLYLAYQEDSPGLGSMEALYSKKCVITLEDSGGTREIVQDGFNGYVVAPDPQELAQRFDALYENRNLARSMGENGCMDMHSRNITWDAVVEKLTQ